VFVVSDGTGETAATVVRAAMLQFQTPWRVRRFNEVRQAALTQRIVDEAAELGAMIVFTLVDKRVAGALRAHAEERGVPVVDLLGPLIAHAATHLRAEPRGQPGLLHGFSDEYFERVEAVEFAVRHDDGANLRTLCEADLVLTGVSRTSKTPLSIYLAQRGYRTGNVPLIPGVDPPRALLELDPAKVVGLSLHPDRLVLVRQARVNALGAPYSSYASREEVISELQRARRLFRAHGWRELDITGRAVEENASRIVALLTS
jgi:regulator of PEP synthase PpsR (kinase-PPPase family)